MTSKNHFSSYFTWIFLGFLFFCASNAFSMTALDQIPTLSTWEHRTAWPIKIIFSASIKEDTVIPENFWIAAEGMSAIVPGTFSFASTNVTNDTVIFTPDDHWILGVHYIVTATSNVTSITGDPFDGDLPEGGEFVANVPMDLDRPEPDPGDPIGMFVNSNVLIGFDVMDPESTDPSKPWTIPGMGATEAWKYTTGRPDVIIAIIDNGLESYHNPELAEHLFLNKGELPMPRNGLTPCPDWDCNGDGRFSASDYANDPRVPSPPPGMPLSPAELLEAFADGVDNDGNGFVDDICGWDFWRSKPDPIGIEQWKEGAHGDARARDAGAIADNGHGDKPGFCPNCTILPIRVSDAIMASHNSIAWGVQYASIMGAQVGIAASGTPDYSWQDEEIILDAFNKGMILVAATGDELGFHHSFPAAGEDVLSIKSIFPIPNLDFLGIFPMELLAFTETYCTNYNEHVHLAGSSGACSSEATGNVGGAAGLIISRALDLGIQLTPNEVKQILTMTADDIQNHCMTLTGGHCQKGFERHFGYGRPNLRNAMIALGDGANPKIPPEVRITSPHWWTLFDPTQSENIEIDGHIWARGKPFTYEVQIAKGPEPLDEDFQNISSGAGQNPIDASLAAFNLYSVFTYAQMAEIVKDFDQFTFTVRVRAYWETKSGNKVMGEDRRAFAAHIDNDPNTGLLPGLPFNLGASGESSPLLYDLDGQDGGKLELIFGTTDGNLEVFGWDDDTSLWARRPGFPVNIRGTGILAKDTILGSPAVGDLFGTGVPIIVVATGNGYIYAIWPNGNEHKNIYNEPDPFLPGFPYQVPRPDPSTPLSWGHGNTLAASPVLADLDADGILEIVVADFQARVFAVKPVDADGDGTVDDMPGFPVEVISREGVVPPDKVCMNDDGNPIEGVQILGTPAIGILDPTSDDPYYSEFPSIVVPTTEVCSGGLMKTGRIYAIRHDGDSANSSPFLDGWPIVILAPLSDALPIPPLTTGITASPAVARLGDTTLIGTGAFAFPPQMLKVKNGTVNKSLLNSEISLNISGHGAFGPLVKNGPLGYALPTLSAIKIVDGWISILRPLIMAWDLSQFGAPVINKDMEDIHFYTSPVIADLDGDGKNEVISGSSGFVVHAFSIDGKEPEGWPKYTFNWIISSAVVGDADGDGKIELFQATHEGHLFGWHTSGPACVDGQLNGAWRKFHHDEYNSGYYGMDTLPPGVARNFVKRAAPDGGTNLTWLASGDDWYCGAASSYDLRVSDDPDKLQTPEGFMAADSIPNMPTPKSAGESEEMTISNYPPSKVFALRILDQMGHKSHITIATEESSDDDAGTDDDVTDDDTSGEDDDSGQFHPTPEKGGGNGNGCGC